MKNWTISKRLVTGFSILTIIILCLGAVTWIQMATISGHLSLITQNSLPELAIVEGIRYQVALLRVTNFKHVMYDAAQKSALDKQAREEETALADLASKFENHAENQEQKALFSKVRPLLEAYRAETLKLREASTRNDAEAVKSYLQSAGKIGNDFLLAVESLRDNTSKEAQNSAGTIESTVASSRWAVLVVSLLGISLGMAIAFFMSRSISRVLQRLVNQLNMGADQTASASSQVSTASQTLAEGASEQAASIEETSSSLEEMSSMTKRNAENAQKANELAKQTRAAADKGASDMQAMSGAMDAIKTSSEDIAKIIKTIDEIAFQTNILALNAAVEAARAGEAGMGFAVVADEVRNLAQRSAQAAKETADKIEGAITKTGQGVEINGKVAQALNDIVTKVRQVDELVAEVAGASQEQTQGITQINTAVGQMDKVTQSNAATAEESAAAAEELNAQAETMKQSVMELLRLVGGNNGQAGGASTVPASSMSRKTHATAMAGNGHAQMHHPVQSAKRTSQLVTASATAGTHRKSEIPMEGDFKDF